MKSGHLLYFVGTLSVLVLQIKAASPTIVEAAAKGNPNGFNITFSEPVDTATATNPLNYSVNNGVSVLGAELLYGTNQTTIVVHTTDLTGTGPYTVTVNAVTDQSEPPNVIAVDSTKFIRRSGEGILARYYGGINGGEPIGGLTLTYLYSAYNRFPDNPDWLKIRSELSIEPYQASNYGAWLNGFYEAPETGEYRFFIASRDQGILYLGTGASPDTKRPIAGEPQFGSNGPRQFLVPNSRSYNEAGSTDRMLWVATNFPNRLSDSVPINDSLNAYGSIHLEAGKRYYIEAQVKSGLYDWLDVAVQTPSGLSVTNGSPAINGSLLSPVPSVLSGPVEIIGQPVIYSINEGGNFETYAFHSGASPFAYQWFRDDVPISGATNFSYRADFVNMDDDGAAYRVRIRNAFSEVLSEPAVLKIIPDTDAPTVVRAEGRHQFDRVLITFSEPMDPATVTSISSYAITSVPDGVPLAVLSAEMAAFDPLVPQQAVKVWLRTGQQTPGMRYEITMTGLQDRAAPPHPLAEPAKVQFTGWVLSPRFVRYEAFPYASPEDLDSLDFDALSSYMQSLSLLSDYPITLPEMSSGSSAINRISGVIIPEVDGEHVFAMTSSDRSRLYLDTVGDGGLGDLIASREVGTQSRAWNFGSGGGHISAPITLASGNHYSFELRYAKSTVAAEASFTWQAPGELPPGDYSIPRLSGDLIACYANPDAPVVNVSLQPTDQTVDEFASVSLTASASATAWGQSPLPLLYQWQRDGLDVAGGTNATLTIASTSVGDAGVYRCQFLTPGKTVLSEPALLTVIPHPLPELDYAHAMPDRQRVIVRFTSRVGSQMASTPDIFDIPGLTISAVRLLSDLQTVELTTSLQTGGQLYTVNVQVIYDFDGTPVELSVTPVQVQFSGPVLTAGYVLREIYTNILGTRIADLTNHASFPGKPARMDYLSAVEYSANPSMPNTGVKISAWLNPPGDGSYQFYVAGADQTLLYLSSDESPANKILLALEPTWNNYRDYLTNDRRINDADGLAFFPGASNRAVNRTENTVGPRSLQAAQRYYLEVLKKKGPGGMDHLAVAMAPAGGPNPVNGSPGIGGALVASYLSPDNRVEITQQPQSLTLPAGSYSGQFSVSAVPRIAGPISYQWYRDGVEIPFATTPSISVPVGIPGSSIPITCKLSAPGAPEVATEVALLTVEPIGLEMWRSGDIWVLSFPSVNANYQIQRATNLPPTGTWELFQTLPPYSGSFEFTQEFPNEFFRIQLTEP